MTGNEIKGYTCSHCGASIDKNSKKCGYCGIELDWTGSMVEELLVETFKSGVFAEKVLGIIKDNALNSPPRSFPRDNTFQLHGRNGPALERCVGDVIPFGISQPRDFLTRHRDEVLKKYVEKNRGKPFPCRKFENGERFTVDFIPIGISPPRDFLYHRRKDMQKKYEHALTNDAYYIKGIKNGWWNESGVLLDTRDYFGMIQNPNYMKPMKAHEYWSRLTGIINNPVTGTWELFDTGVGGIFNDDEVNLTCTKCGNVTMLEICEKCGTKKNGYVYQHYTDSLFHRCKILVKVMLDCNDIVLKFVRGGGIAVGPLVEPGDMRTMILSEPLKSCLKTVGDLHNMKAGEKLLFMMVEGNVVYSYESKILGKTFVIDDVDFEMDEIVKVHVYNKYGIDVNRGDYVLVTGHVECVEGVDKETAGKKVLKLISHGVYKYDQFNEDEMLEEILVD